MPEDDFDKSFSTLISKLGLSKEKSLKNSIIFS